MASPNISFDTLPASIRKPGKYFEFNTKLAVRTLPANVQRVLIVAQGTAEGSQPALTPVEVFSDEEARTLFGTGSLAHLMVRAAITANPYLRLSVITVADDAAGIAATGKVALSGTSAGVGVVSLTIGAQLVQVSATLADTAAAVAASLAARHARARSAA